MNYEKDRKQLIYIILAVVIAFCIYKIIGVTILVPMIKDNIVRPFVGECIFVSATVIAAIFVKKIWSLKPTAKGFLRGLLVGWPLLFLVLMGCYNWSSQIKSGEMAVTISGGKIIMLAVTSLLVGIAEELLIRGVLINGLLDYYGKVTASSIRKAVILSSVIFGSLHLFNVFNGVTILSAVIQTINAVGLGVIFGAVYIRTSKNLWPCIILHAVWDFNGFIIGGMLMGNGTSDAVNGGGNFSVLGMAVLYVAYALFLLRNKKVKEFEGN